jgi:hypothetical protein
MTGKVGRALWFKSALQSVTADAVVVSLMSRLRNSNLADGDLAVPDDLHRRHDAVLDLCAVKKIGGSLLNYIYYQLCRSQFTM